MLNHHRVYLSLILRQIMQHRSWDFLFNAIIGVCFSKTLRRRLKFLFGKTLNVWKQNLIRRCIILSQLFFLILLIRNLLVSKSLYTLTLKLMILLVTSKIFFLSSIVTGRIVLKRVLTWKTFILLRRSLHGVLIINVWLLFHILHLRWILELLERRHTLLVVIILVGLSSLIHILSIISVPLLLIVIVRRHSWLSHAKLRVKHLLKFLKRTLRIILVRWIMCLLSEIVHVIRLSSLSAWVFVIISFNV